MAATLNSLGMVAGEASGDLLASLVLAGVRRCWPEADGDTAEAIDFCEFYAREMERLAQRSRYRDGEVFGRLIGGWRDDLSHGSTVPLSIRAPAPSNTVAWSSAVGAEG